MTDAQRFHELTGGCWHEYDKIIGLYNKCSCGKICGNLDEHIKQSNPTYSNAADILNRMKEFCGEIGYKLFLCKLLYAEICWDYLTENDYDGVIYVDYILNPPSLLKKAVEFFERRWMMNETTNSNLRQTHLCKLKEPATCQHRVDGKFSWTILCGANPLNDDFKKCPYKEIGEIVIKEST